jgi:hypothetical protein
MKSRISIEVDFENGNQPVIQILQTNSDDVRDKLLSNFCQQFGGSSWCTIKWVSQAPDKDNVNAFYNRIHIAPVSQSDFLKEAAIMVDQDRLNKLMPNSEDEVDKQWDEVANFIGGDKMVLDTETLNHLKFHYHLIPSGNHID